MNFQSNKDVIWSIIDIVTSKTGGVPYKDRGNWISQVKNMMQSSKDNNLCLDSDFFDMIHVLTKSDLVYSCLKIYYSNISVVCTTGLV